MSSWHATQLLFSFLTKLLSSQIDIVLNCGLNVKQLLTIICDLYVLDIFKMKTKQHHLLPHLQSCLCCLRLTVPEPKPNFYLLLFVARLK